MMSALAQDLRYALRQLVKTPGFTIVAVLTLALGIGANTAIFSVVYGVLLRPLPFAEPERLAMLCERWDRHPHEDMLVSPGNFSDWREQSQSFERMAAYDSVFPSPVTLADGDEPLRIRATSVSGEFFATLGVRPAVGRAFSPEELHDAGRRAVVIGHGFWQRLGGDPHLIGKNIILYRKPHTVVGIMPRGFAFPDECEIWSPKPQGELGLDRNNHCLRVVGRLRSGASVAQARSEMNSLAARLREAYPENRAVVGVGVVPVHEQMLGRVRRALLVLLGAVICVLGIACANVANLTLARSVGRGREVALRMALGAGRRRVIQYLLTESLLLAILGGALGLVGAYSCVQAFVALDPLELPRIQEIAVDGDVLWFTLLVSVGSSVLFGLLPAWRASRPDLNSALKENAGLQVAGGLHRNYYRNALIVAQVALAIVVVAGAGLLLRSFVARVSVPIGFQPDRLLALELPWSAHRHLDEIFTRLRALPGVEAVGASTALPHEPAQTHAGFEVEGRLAAPDEELIAGRLPVTLEYFRAAGMPLRAGRLFTHTDSANAPKVAIVNEALARRCFRDANPIGGRIRWGGDEWRQIIGVVGNVKGFGVDGDPTPAIYMPYTQERWENPVFVVVRTAVPPASLASAVRKEIHAWNRRALIGKLAPIEVLLWDSVAIPRFYMWLVGTFAALALALTAIGVYGVVSYSMSQRTHEIGVRMALGADRGDVRDLVVGQGLRPILAGVAIGLVCAWPTTRLLESLLFGVRPNDAVTFVAVAAVLIVVGVAACYLPARRASKVDPVVALRCE